MPVIDRTNSLLDILEENSNDIILAKTMSFVFTLGYIRSIINNDRYTDIDKECLSYCSDIVYPSIIRFKLMDIDPHWDTMKYSCVVYLPPKGWFDIVSGKEVPNGNIRR